MQIPLEKIKIKHRVRHELQDIEALRDSMRRYGLLNPITVNSDYVLIAGARRLEAARQLGWHTINAVILEETDAVNELEIEIEENVQRSNFTDDELMSAYMRLEKLKNPGFFTRLWRAIVAFFKRLFGKKY
ncbi:ParB N-terminal domain-containing protein [Brucepastera parasyntrophica]|uniref:ParB N-terminal domain-containing protein n=1 Tax=Brucepastera parasyntrophica TaxID=2880008 RepID=UPI00210C299F|nr:ParB N-terminal domain-containing protein [Brucepastera parasyntrophica]ULQ59461.1 ParB N-terminal domain-containing protein [Brucepastera parasyntrophica]